MVDVNPLLGDNYRYDTDSGHFISGKHQRVAEIINEYDSDLFLAWIPPENRDETDVFPYVLIYFEPNGNGNAVSYWTEAELDERILEHVFENDFKKHSPNEIFDRMTAKNLARDLLTNKEIEDRYQEKLEFPKFLAETNLHTVTHKGRKYR